MIDGKQIDGHGAFDALSSVKSWRAVGDGTTDDTAAIQAALTANAGVRETYFPAGTYKITGPITVPSYSVLLGGPGVTLTSTMTNGTGFANAVFLALGVTGAGTTLSSAPTPGSTTVPVADTALFPVGTVAYIGKGNRYAYYKVLARSVASGAGNLTVERPLRVFDSGDDCLPATSRPTGIRIDGRGMTINSANAKGGDRAIELSGALDCVIENVNVDATLGFGGIVVSLDIGSHRSHIKNVHVRGAFDALGGIAMESAEDCRIEHCTAIKCTTTATRPGIFVVDCIDCHVVDSASSLNSIGISFDYGGSTAEGSYRCTVRGCTFIDNTSHGAQVQGGSLEVQFLGTQFRYNGGNGVICQSGATGVQFDACNGSNNVGSGFTIAAGATASLSNCVAKSNALNGVDAFGDTVAMGCVADENGQNPAIATSNVGFNAGGAAKVTWMGCTTIPYTTNGVFADGFFHGSTGECKIVGCRINASGTGTKVGIQHEAASTLYVSDTSMSGGAYGYYSATATAVLRRGANVNLESATTPYTLQRANFGTFTSNGVTQVDTTGGVGSFPVGSQIVISLKTIGGTPELAVPYFSATPIADHFYTKSITAGGNGVWNWMAIC